MVELNIRDLPDYRQGVVLTGEIGVTYTEGRWERDGQKHLCPLSYLILRHQPPKSAWLSAVCHLTGWTPLRALTFKLIMGNAHGLVTASSVEAKKGATDAALYSILYKLSRKNNAGR